MDTEVIPITRPGRLLPLKPLEILDTVPRRRLSQSWTDNLDEEKSSSIDVPKSPGLEIEKSTLGEVQKSPLRKVAAFFSDQRSPALKEEKKLQKQQSFDKEKKGARRESIKGQLLKFKQKAGKVLEEVHERFSEDHSAVAPLVASPVGKEGAETDEPSGSERVTSPTSSLSSKRTTSSAEMKASLRNKIRKQAEKVVERTRGSVQLTKRLQRRLTVHTEETVTEEDLKNVDEQIEESIRMGEKFMAHQPASVFPSEEDQFLFFTGTYPVDIFVPINHGYTYTSAVPSKDYDLSLFFVQEPNTEDVENRAALRDNLMKKRFPPSIWTEQMGTETIVERKYRWNQPETDVCSYLPAMTSEARQNVEWEKIKLHMTVIIQGLTIVNHALSTVEEGIAASLRHHYVEQMALYDEIDNLLEEQENRSTEWQKKLTKLEYNFTNGAESLRQQWNALESSRASQGFAVTPLRYTLLDSNYGVCTEDYPIKEMASLPAEVREKLEKKNRVMIKISLFYNDILVGTTPSRHLANYNIAFDEVFNLELTSIPQKLHVIISEIEGKVETSVARIEIKLPWTKDMEQKPIPFQEFIDTKEIADRMRGFLIAYVDWDPPQNIKREKKIEKSQSIVEEPFSLIPRQCRLVSDDDFDSNLRWEMLEKRQMRKLPKSLESKPIPLDSSEIDPSIMINEERTQHTAGFRTGIDAHRMTGTGYATMIRTKILEKRRDTERRLTYEEVVKEVALPSGIGGIGSLFGPTDTSRKLKPMRMENVRQQTSGQTGTKLLVNVQSATNLPERKNGTLQPLVEVYFQQKTGKTSMAVGKHPSWQQCIILPLDVENIGDLKTITDHVHIDIYDQLVSPLPKDDRESNTVHEQLLYRYIGSVRIPFSTIYCRGRIDGGLRIQLPLFIIGYTISEKPAYIKLLIALEPSLCASKITSQTNETSEPEKIVQQCETWAKQNKEQFDDRRYVSLVNDINGKLVLVCRYLRGIPAPPALEPIIAGQKTFEKLAKVISYIPFLADPLLFPGHLDLWTTIDQFVSYGCGDEEEHAILLCCWLLGHRITSYLVLGSALPEGEKAAYVLVELLEGFVLVNSSDGSVYQIDDPMCPLLSVGCVVSSDNVYANIQPRVHPSQLHFDFTKTNEWRPLFQKPDNTLVSIQPSGITYQQIMEDAAIELRSSLERELKLRFDEARPFAIPQWNLMASRLLREILYEDNWTQNVVDDRFHRLRESYNVFATAIRIPYLTLHKCVEEILRLKLHLNTDPTVQFALGVHINQYFNNIISCSLGIAILMPKR